MSASTTEALRRLRASGRRALLVTGRQIGDLRRAYPDLGVFDWVVGENGAVLYDPSTERVELLSQPFPKAFLERLKAGGVSPLDRGDVVVASLVSEIDKIRAAIDELALEARIIKNREAAMVLPAGIDKASGVSVALRRLGVSFVQVVAVGDSENDEVLFRACGLGVAVQNAIAPLRRIAHHVTLSPEGKGVEELIEELVSSDLRRIAS